MLSQDNFKRATEVLPPPPDHYWCAMCGRALGDKQFWYQGMSYCTSECQADGKKQADSWREAEERKGDRR